MCSCRSRPVSPLSAKPEVITTAQPNAGRGALLEHRRPPPAPAPPPAPGQPAQAPRRSTDTPASPAALRISGLTGYRPPANPCWRSKRNGRALIDCGSADAPISATERGSNIALRTLAVIGKHLEPSYTRQHSDNEVCEVLHGDARRQSGAGNRRRTRNRARDRAGPGQAGAKVVVNDLGTSLSGEGAEALPADQVVDEILTTRRHGRTNRGNVASFDDATAMVEQVIRTFGRIDILVNVAGILRDRMIFNMTEAEWDAVIAVHLKGTFNCTRAASIPMREQHGGRIISMSSVSALGSAGQPNYAAAKAGIMGLTWSTANALGSYGVTCNAIMPSGATRMIDSTPRGKKVFEDTGKWPSELAVRHRARP